MDAWLFKHGRGFQLPGDVANLDNRGLSEKLGLVPNAPAFGGALDLEDTLFYSEDGQLAAIRVQRDVLVARFAFDVLHARIMTELGGVRLDENGNVHPLDMIQGGMPRMTRGTEKV